MLFLDRCMEELSCVLPLFEHMHASNACQSKRKLTQKLIDKQLYGYASLHMYLAVQV